MAEKSPKEKFYMGNTNLPTGDMEFEYTEEQVAEMKLCIDDISHFAENYFYILSVDDGKKLITLHDSQKRILTKLKDNRFFCLLASRQIGKALDINTPINTPTGWTTMGDLKDGDQVYGIDGTPCNVVKAHDYRYDRECFDIEFDNGEVITADAEHEWFTQSKTERKSKRIGSNKTTEELYKNFKTSAGEPVHRIPSCINGLENTEKILKIPPYILGLWLGDGSNESSRITIGDRDIEESIKILNEYSNDYSITSKKYKNRANTVNIGFIKGESRTTSLVSQLKELELLNNKHIPKDYLNASREQRLALLQGLMDSDGYINPSGLGIFYNTNLALCAQVKELIEGLGYKTSYNTFTPTLYGVPCLECGEISFTPRELVCRLSFKADRIKVENNKYPISKKRNQWHYIKDIRKVESVPVRCISVDSPDHLFLAGKTLIPTHNSTLFTIYLLWFAIFFPDQRILLVANKEATAIEIFSRVRMAYEMLPNWLKAGVVNWAKTSMELTNGSRIQITTTTGTAARGQSVSLLLIDEAAFIESHLMDPFWASVFPIVSSSKKAKVFMCSTPNGTGNLFYDIYTGAKEGKNGWGCDRILWDEVPGRDEAWAEEIKGGLASEEKWRQEFLCEFLNSGESSMTEADYKYLLQYVKEPVEVLMDGHYKIFEKPVDDRIYIAGIDTSDGIGGDFSCIKILDITDLDEIIEVAEYYNNQIPVAEFANVCYDILCHWGKPLCCVERNNQGGQIADRLGLDLGYLDRLVSWGGKLAGRKNQALLGMISSRNTKIHACANARYFYSDKMAVQFRNQESLDEIVKDFVKYPNDTWAAISGRHDDRTMALIWALMILDKEIVDNYFSVDEYDKFGKPSKISALDYGIKLFENPTSLYTNEEVDGIENSQLAPVSFGMDTMANEDIADLQAQGWRFANDEPYRNPDHEISKDDMRAIDKWFS